MALLNFVATFFLILLVFRSVHRKKSQCTTANDDDTFFQATTEATCGCGGTCGSPASKKTTGVVSCKNTSKFKLKVFFPTKSL